MAPLRTWQQLRLTSTSDPKRDIGWLARTLNSTLTSARTNRVFGEAAMFTATVAHGKNGMYEHILLSEDVTN
jgi:hypothetical protein